MEQYFRFSNLLDSNNKNMSKLDGSLYVQLIFFPADRADQRRFLFGFNQRKSA
jgi:hypothetical protein